MNWPCTLPTKHTHTHTYCPEWWRVFCVGETATAFRTNIDTCAATREGRGSQTKPKAVAIRWFIGQFAPPPLSTLSTLSPLLALFPAAHKRKAKSKTKSNSSCNCIDWQAMGKRKGARKQRAAGNTPLPHSTPHSPSKQGFNFGRWVSQLKRTLYRQPQPHPPLPQSFVINTEKKAKQEIAWMKNAQSSLAWRSYSQASTRETIWTITALFISVFIVV